MLKKLEYEGICSTCRHAPMCIFRKDAVTPILQCDEFEGLASAGLSAGGTENARTGQVASTAQLQSSTKSGPKGLCMNCKNAKNCRFPKPEGGVWRCDEYE